MMHLSTQWRARGLLVLGLVSVHAALFLAVISGHPSTGDSNAPPMFGPVVSDIPGATHPRYLTSKEWSPPPPADSVSPSGSWRFATIDIWPTDRPSSGKPTSFTPVSEAVPDELAAEDGIALEKWAKSTRHGSKLRMMGWVRPTYTLQQARAGQEGSVLISVHVNEQGQPIEALLMNSSGFPDIDSATLDAARLWRFAPPLSRSEPISVWAQMEVQYHR